MMRSVLRVLMMLTIVLAVGMMDSVLAKEGVVRESKETIPPLTQRTPLHITLEKSGPASVAIDEVFEITIKVNNTGEESVSLVLTEAAANVEVIEPDVRILDFSADVYAARPPEIGWTVTLAAGATETLMYRAKALQVGPLSIGPTIATVDGQQFFSNPIHVIVQCTQGVCDPALGESYLTCPEKCEAPSPQAMQPPSLRRYDLILGGMLALAVLAGLLWRYVHRKKHAASSKKTGSHKKH